MFIETHSKKYRVDEEISLNEDAVALTASDFKDKNKDKTKNCVSELMKTIYKGW